MKLPILLRGRELLSAKDYIAWKMRERNRHKDVKPSQQKGTAGQRRLQRQQDACQDCGKPSGGGFNENGPLCITCAQVRAFDVEEEDNG